MIDNEIDKVNSQIEKACELVEAGAYTKELFKKRIDVLNNQLEALINQKQELPNANNITQEFNNKKKAIPILEDILSKYAPEMTAEEKNELLSTIIKKVIYKKVSFVYLPTKAKQRKLISFINGLILPY